MENLDWTTHTRGHWEADHCGMCLHVFKSLNGSCWSVYNQEIEIDGRGAMVPFEEAKARAVAAAERWNNHELAAVTAERDAALAELAEVKKNMLRFSADGMRITRENTKADALELALSLMAERDALQAQLATLKKRVADAPRKMLYQRDESEKTKLVAVLALEDGE